MSEELLTTKLNIPPSRPNLVARPRLLRLLEKGLRRPLTMLSAPAGFGKTTLLTEWFDLRAGERPQRTSLSSEGARERFTPTPVHRSTRAQSAWLSLDEGDNDPVRFFSYFIAALQTIDESIGKKSHEGLHSPQPAPLESILTILINEISLSDRSIVLVLDDYHLIRSDKIHRALTFLLENLPSSMHLVMSSRVDPPLPLARLRARDQIVEIRAVDLRFSSAEVASFFLQRAELALSEEQVDALEMRTEGWVAGLQLAALAMQRREDVTNFIQSFAGDNRYIVDYLAQEVLDGLPEQIKEFLLKTSILERMSAPLCEAVTGQRNAQTILEKLDDSNLFLVPLDSNRTWYRYHHLFLDFLRHQLEETENGIVSELHGKAAGWHEDQGFTRQAVDHALAAGDYEQAARLVEEAAQSTFALGEFTTLRGWLEALPEAIIHRRPKLCLANAWANLMAGHISEIEPHLEALEALIHQSIPENSEHRLSEAEVRMLRAQIFSIRGEVACSLGEVAEAAEYSRLALELLPEEEVFLRGMNAINMTLNIAEADLTRDHVANTYATLMEAVRASRAAGDAQSTFYALGLAGMLQIARGQLKDAARMLRDALRMVDENELPPVVGLVYAAVGLMHYEWNDLESAEDYLQKAIKMGEAGEDIRPLVPGYEGLARLHLARGEVRGAQEYLRIAERLAERTQIGWVTTEVRAGRVRLWLAQGDLDAVSRWVRQSGLGVGDPIGYNRQGEYLALARAYFTLGQFERALALLDWLLGMMEPAGLMGVVIEIQALQALVLKSLADHEGACSALESALVLAEPEGFVRTFADEDETMAELLHVVSLQVEGSLGRYVDQLLTVLESSTQSIKPSTSGRQHLSDPLTDRELEVLSLIAEGMTNKDIARELVIAPGTVKRHAHNIYTKLTVSNRTQAIVRARELDLLQTEA